MTDAEIAPKEGVETAQRLPAIKLKLAMPWLLTAFLVLLQFSLVPFIPNAPGPRNFIIIPFIGLNLAFAAVVAIWCVVLRKWWLYLLGIPVLLFAGVGLDANTGGTGEWLVRSIPIAIALIAIVTLVMLTFVSGKFQVLQYGEDSFSEGLQFRIFHLMIATAVISVLCAIGIRLWPWLASQIRMSSTLRILSLNASISLSTIFAVWAILGNSIGRRLVILVSLQIACALLSHLCFPNLPFSYWLCLMGIVMASINIQLFLLRRIGYRFVK